MRNIANHASSTAAKETLSHAAEIARQQGPFGVCYASLSKSFKSYHTAGMSAKAAAASL
jgi:hypothetical protein